MCSRFCCWSEPSLPLCRASVSLHKVICNIPAFVSAVPVERDFVAEFLFLGLRSSSAPAFQLVHHRFKLPRRLFIFRWPFKIIHCLSFRLPFDLFVRWGGAPSTGFSPDSIITHFRTNCKRMFEIFTEPPKITAIVSLSGQCCNF